MCGPGSLRLRFNLPPPIAESLERNPLRFAILSLIQRALLPRLMVLAPESLAVTLTGSKFVGPVVASLLKFIGENRSRPNRGQQVCEKWTLTILQAKIPCYRLKIPCSPKYF